MASIETSQDIGAKMIICRAIQEKSLFMNARGEILPCCFVHINDPITISNLKYFMQDINFDKLSESWNSDQPYQKCVDVCDSESTHRASIKNFDKQWKIFQDNKK